MNQGRKVFDGALASIREAQNWVASARGGFTAALKWLRQDQLIVNEPDGAYVALAAGAKPEQVARCLASPCFGCNCARNPGISSAN